MLNWKDTKNPEAGGAEVVTNKHLQRWVQAGHECTLFCRTYKGCKPIESINGYKVLRRGGKFTVYFEAYKHNKNHEYDLIIDQINTIPFFTPLYIKNGSGVAFIHQLCKEIWFYEMPFPISMFGYLAEQLYLKLYRSYPTIVVSHSTRKDLEKIGFRKIHVIPNASDLKPIKKIPTKRPNTLIFVARLKKSKRLHHVLEALVYIKKEIPDIMLWVVGEGDTKYKKQIIKLLKKYGLQNNVKLFGYINQKKKMELMTQAQAIIVTSVKEGWGLVVTEANSMGTPAITYNIDGVRDSVKSGETGLILKNNNPKRLSEAIIHYLKSDLMQHEFVRNSIEDAKTHQWKISTNMSLNMIQNLR